MASSIVRAEKQTRDVAGREESEEGSIHGSRHTARFFPIHSVAQWEASLRTYLRNITISRGGSDIYKKIEVHNLRNCQGCLFKIGLCTYNAKNQ